MRSTIFLSWWILSSMAFAQAPAISALEKEAQDRYQAHDWAAASAAYAKVIADKPSDPWAHYFYAVALQEQGRHTDAIAHLQEADKLGLPQVQSAFRYARSYAQTKQVDRAFDALSQAIGLGFAQKNLLESDSLLEPLRSDRRFPELLDKIERAANPCKYRAETHQLDFWIGEWEVYTALAPTTAPIATSSIEASEGGCAILEHYHQNGGYVGRSISAYDTASGKWRQFYIDNGGRVTEYTGEFRDGKLVFESSLANGRGRMTFSKEGPDLVRQVLERTTDNVTWTKTYDGLYRRKKSP